MNLQTQNIQRLIDHLRKPSTAEHFDLNLYIRLPFAINTTDTIERAINDCGAVACIAGHAVLLDYPSMAMNDLHDIHEMARQSLGLTVLQAEELFTPDDTIIEFNLVTPEIAATVLENLLVTDLVQWPEYVYYNSDDHDEDNF